MAVRELYPVKKPVLKEKYLRNYFNFRGQMESRGGRSRHRKFYELPSESEGNDVQAVGLEAKTDRDALTKYINSSVIGKDTTFLRY